MSEMLVKVNLYEKQLEELLNVDFPRVINHASFMFDEVAGDLAESILLFGSGTLGRHTLARLRNINIEPLAFVDNNAALWDSCVDGLRVLSPREAVEQFADKAVFVVTIYNGSVVRQQLKDMNCTRVVPFAGLFWKYADAFLPHCALDYPHKILSDAENVRRGLSVLADEPSRREYVAQLRWQLLLDFDNLPMPLPADQTYFPADLISSLDDEVFVDCGAFDGDVIRTFLNLRGKRFENIVALEPDPENFKKLQNYVFGLDDDLRSKIILRRIAAAEHRGGLRFDSTGTVISSSCPEGTTEVEGFPLSDLDIAAEPTYIKMDIEGTELDALAGARGIIEKGEAVLAICTYHRQEHLWQIPLYIHSVAPKYRLFLRRYAEECWESVCYAVPENRLIGN